MTSANVIEYTIYKGENRVGSFSKNVMCKFPDYSELLKYQPLKEHTILPWGYDEEEEEWEGRRENLENYLKKMVSCNKWLRAYFRKEKTAEEILQEIKEAYDEMTRKMKEGFAKRREELKRI